MYSIYVGNINPEEFKKSLSDLNNKSLMHEKLVSVTYAKSSHIDLPGCVKFGTNFIIGNNCSIGYDGFSYISKNGVSQMTPHIGGVIIGNNVHVGNNCCISRGTVNDTIIGNNVKIDNFVHIAHNCTIGNNVIIGAGAIIGGSTIVDDNAVIHMGEVISSHSHIKNEEGQDPCDLVGEIKTKLIIVDLDNTLWEGVLGDEGGIKIKDEHISLQRKLKELSKKGVLLAIVSKNNEEIALKELETNKLMEIKKEDFITWRINWENKSKNIEEILKELNLSSNGVIIIDDSPHERNLIESLLPDVNVLTEEDAVRLNMYKVEKSRQNLKKKFKNLEEWLASLNMQFKWEEYLEENKMRILQLLNKVNQMNLSTNRYTEEEFLKFKDMTSNIYTLSLSDIFGDYGLVGVMLVYDNTLIDFVLSCRAMGRGVEERMLNFLLSKHPNIQINVEGKQTKFNKPCIDFFNSIK